MRDVCVITGGGNGIGLATAKYMPKEKILVICGRTESKLKAAAEELTALGHEVHYIVCDVSSRKDVHELCLFARSFGRIRNVIHAAGMSPSMGDPEKLVRVNAIGTKNINMEFYKYMEEGSVIVDVASNAAYQVPGFLIRKNIYSLAEKDEDAFIRKMTAEAKLPEEVTDSQAWHTLFLRISRSGMPENVRMNTEKRAYAYVRSAPALWIRIWAAWKKRRLAKCSERLLKSVWERLRSLVFVSLLPPMSETAILQAQISWPMADA